MRSIALVTTGVLLIATHDATADVESPQATTDPPSGAVATPEQATPPPAPPPPPPTLATTTTLPAAVTSKAAPDVDASAPTTSPTIAGVTISGSLDAYASFNPARSATNTSPNELYAFETQANGASVSFAKITLERKPGPVGFRLDVGFGETIDLINATDTASGMGHDVMRNLEQAYVAWAATPAVTLKVGKMVTHHGMEVIESQANWNYTHSLLFTWAIPFTQTGIAVDWVATDRLEMTLFVVNGLNNTFEGNTFKSPGFQLIYKPTPAVSLTQNFSAFNEQAGDKGKLTSFDQAIYLFDTIAAWTISDAFELAANSDIAIDESLPSDKIFAGIAGYARWHSSPKTAVSVRAEYFHDNDSPTLGILLPMKGNVVEGTATFTYAPAAGLLLRGEARLDRGLDGYKPFSGSDAMPYSTSQQATFTLGAVAAF